MEELTKGRMRGTNDPYFDWLSIIIGLNKNYSRRNYIQLVTTLHATEYNPLLPLDNNRGIDGLQLRVEFMNEHGAWGSATNRGPCSFLEFLVGVSRRMSFLMYGEGNHTGTEFYFWKLIDNLGLTKCTDDRWEYINGEFFVEDAIWRVNQRQYSYDGSGGLFPLRNPKEDQKNVEVWYQMNQWLIEQSDVGDLF